MDFREYAKRLNEVTESQVEQGVLSVLKQNERKATDLNTSQLYQGLDSKGQALEPAYSPLTVEIKKYKGDPYDRVTLYDTGTFYSRFYIGEQFPLLFNSMDFKTGRLAEKYGEENIFGLDQSNIAELGKAILPDLQDEFRKILLLR